MAEAGAAAGPSSRRAAGRTGSGSTGSGHWIVAGLIVLGAAAAVTGIAFQRFQTRRCLAFYGPQVARRITAAPRVEVWVVRPAAGGQGLVAVERVDVSRAPGLVHMRRGLVEDANFVWEEPRGVARGAGPARLPVAAWDVAIVFSDAPDTKAETTLVVDLDPAGGALAVVGQPGRIGLGRIAAGLEKWIRGTLDEAGVRDSRQKTGLLRAAGRSL